MLHRKCKFSLMKSCSEPINRKRTPGFHFNIKTAFPGKGMPIVKIRQLWDHLIPYTGKIMSLYWDSPLDIHPTWSVIVDVYSLDGLEKSFFFKFCIVVQYIQAWCKLLSFYHQLIVSFVTSMFSEILKWYAICQVWWHHVHNIHENNFMFSWVSINEISVFLDTTPKSKRTVFFGPMTHPAQLLRNLESLKHLSLYRNLA